MATTDMSLLSTFQKHIEDMRNLSLCKICIKPFYEPFILPCGHTYCYSCLANWFGGSQSRKRKKNCPDCRAEVKMQPSPNYLLRDLVHMFIGRAELLPEDETVQEHQQAKEEEALLLAADRTGVGLFKGAFKQSRHLHHLVSWRQGIMDYEDGVVRCPECHWELEEGECYQCGFIQYEPGDSESESDELSMDSQSIHTVDTDFDGDGDEVDHEFDSTMHFGGYDPYEEYGTATDATGSDRIDSYDENDDMDGFIDDERDDDDAASGSTMVINPYGGILYPANSRDDSHTTAQGETSDANTNYDEETDASEVDHNYVPTRTRPRRVVLSDDSEEEISEESSEDERTSREATGTTDDDNDDGRNAGNATSAAGSLDNLDGAEHDSEDSDIRPPQPSTLRRQRLQGQRFRRNYQNYPLPPGRRRGVQADHIQARQRREPHDLWEEGILEYRSSGELVRHDPPSHSRAGFGQSRRGTALLG
ncbi:hypothetical protein ABEF95_003667 [Exophiala dermatitidis]